MDTDAPIRLAKWLLVSASVLSLAVFFGVAVKSLVSWKAILLSFVVLVPVFYLSYRLSRARRAYDRGRYGIGRRVVTEQTTLSRDGCSVCDRAGDDGRPGVRRRFVKELVVDGVSIALVDSGHNDYCAECAGTAAESDDANESRPVSDERIG